MDLVTWVQEQWGAISAAPVAYLGTCIIVWLSAMTFTRMRLGDEAAAAKERAELFKQKIADLEDENSELLVQLEAHGADISQIKAQLASQPRLFVQDEEPLDTKPGDIWIK